MKRISLSLVIAFFMLPALSFSQDWVSMMLDPNVNFYDVQKAFNKWYKKNEKEIERERKEHADRSKNNNNTTTIAPQKGVGGNEADELEGAWMLYKRWEATVGPRVYPTGDRLQMYAAMNDFASQHMLQNGNTNGGNGQSKGNNNSNGNKNSSGGGPNTLAGNWTLLGPTSTIPTNGGAGRCNALRVDPTNASILYACAPAGGLWKSTNGGTTWTMWNTDGLAAIGATDLAIDPTNTQVMYLASGDGEAGDTYSLGVLKSTNGGATWNATGLSWLVTQGRTISKLLIDPTNTQIIHAATSSGIYRTTDGGTTWTQIMTGSWKDMEFMPGTPATIYAVSYNPGQFWRSTNSGASYTQVTTGLPASGTIRFAIAVTPNNNNRIWLLAGNNTNYGFYGFYTSSNGGTSFTQVTVSSPSNLLGWALAGNDTGGQAWYDLSIACNPTNQNDIVVGGVNAWRSTNGGTSWTMNAYWQGTPGGNYAHADMHDINWPTGSGTTYYISCDGGVFKTTNNGTNWNDLSNGLQIAEMYRLSTSATNVNLNLSGHQDNGTNRYSSGTWAEVIGGDGMECIIDWSNANTMYGELYYGDIRKSTNGGASFPTQIVNTGGTGVNAQGNWVTPYIMHPTANQTLLVGKAAIYRSTNGGTSWAALGATTGGSGNIVQMAYAPSNPNYIYAIKQNAIFVSTNGGTSFTNVTGTVPTSNAFTYITCSNTDPLKAWVTISGYTTANKVFQTSNGGTSWTNVTGTGLPNLPVNCVVYQNGTPDGVYVGTDVGVYYKDNTLSSWVPFYTGMPNVRVDELEIQYTAGKIRAATFGRGMWESTLYSSGSSAPVANYTSNYRSGCPGIQIQFTDQSAFSPTSWSWNFPGGTPATSTAQNPLITYNSVGTYPVSLWATNGNGSDSVLHTWVTISTTVPLPLVEGFQSLPFLPTNWTANDINNDAVFWQRSTTVGGYSTSTACSYFDNYTLDVAGARDEMWTPKYNLTTLSTCSLTFDVAYARYDVTYSDSLEVLASTNCGQTWTSIYLKGGTTLSTSPDLTTQFVPTNTQWRTETVNLNSYVTSSTFMVAFRNRGHYGNMIYVDNINITGAPASGPPAAAFTASQTSFCQNSCINFTDNSTNSPTSWSWTFPGGTPGTSTAQNPTNICFNTSGTYTVSLTATNSNGSSTATQVITVNALPTVTKSPSAPAICNGSSVNITASGATTYSWSPATGLNCTTCATVTANPTATTTYTITGTNAAGCTNTTTVTVTVNPLPTISKSPPAPSYCPGGSVNITASGGVSYVWSPATGLNCTTCTTVTANPTATTTYTITGTGANGCTNTTTVTVTVNPNPTVTATPSAPSYCAGGSVSITASGANTYAWSPATGLSCTTCATVTANPTATTTYTITGTSSAGCTATRTVTVTVNPLPTISKSPTAPAICNGSSVNITASGGVSYVWAPATGLNCTTCATVTASPTATTTYTITGTGANGCTNTTTVTVTVNPLPNISKSPSAPAICTGGSVNITASGGVSYVWAPATGLNCTTCATVTANPTATTTYTITGTGANGCTNTTTVTVTVNPLPNITATPSAPAVCNSGSVSITASGANTYVWSPATGLNCTTCATVIASPTATTTYTITGTSSAGCTNTATVTVTVNANPTANAGPDVAICTGSSSTLTATGGGTYSWAPATGLSCTTCASPVATPTVTTSYTVTVTNGAGCTATDVVVVTVNPLPPVPTISQAGNVLTSTAATTYQWYLNNVLIPGATSQSYTITQSGSYSVCVTNTFGCSNCSTGFAAVYTGMTDDLTAGTLSIYPNPNSGEFNITFDLANKDTYTVELTDAIGKIVYREVLDSFSGHFSRHFDVKIYGAGTYLFTLKNSKNQSVKKVIVY